MRVGVSDVEVMRHAAFGMGRVFGVKGVLVRWPPDYEGGEISGVRE